MERADFIIVGAGPAGLFAALELVRAGKKVVLLDKGSPIAARNCPIKTGAAKACVHCNPCAVVCGWGGAGAHSDGKLTLTPEFGGNLERTVGRERLLDLIAEVDRTFVRFGADSPVYEPDPLFAAGVIRKGRAAGLQVIPARIRHMGTDRARQVLESFYDELDASCDVRTRAEVERVLVKEGRVCGVQLKDGTRFEAPAVLLAPGREGAPWMERIASDLALAVDSLPVDIGVRVEIPDEIANDLTEQFYEVKAIFDAPTFDDRVRTFCMCPHGEVVTEYQSDSGLVIVNGHSNRDRKTGNTNFAILVSTEFTQPFRDPNGYGGAIARLANMLGGTVLVQRLGDLKAGRRSTANRIERGLVRPTLPQAEPGTFPLRCPTGT